MKRFQSFTLASIVFGLGLFATFMIGIDGERLDLAGAALIVASCVAIVLIPKGGSRE